MTLNPSTTTILLLLRRAKLLLLLLWGSRHSPAIPAWLLLLLLLLLSRIPVLMILLIGTALVAYPAFTEYARQTLTSFQRCRLVSTLLLDPPVPPQRVTSWEAFAA